MKKDIPLSTLTLRKAMVSGIVLSAGAASFLRADAQGLGREWFQQNAHRDPTIRRQKLLQEDALEGNSGNDLLLRVLTPGCAEMGTPADEILFFGGSSCDTAFGLAGEDILYCYTATTTDTLIGDGGSGADYVLIYGRGPTLGYGGTEEDEIEVNSLQDVFASGGDHADIVKGYSYNDDVSLSGDAGDDLLGGYAYHGSVVVSGGDDNDELHALAIIDSVYTNGGPGDDRIYSGSKTKKQTALGGSGNDFIYGASLTGSRNVLDGGAGDDVLVVGINHPYSASPTYAYTDSYLDGGSGNDLLLAHSGNDTLIGGGGMDILRAGSGDDLMIAADNLLAEADGGTGTDLLAIDFSLDIYATTALLAGLERLDISGTSGNTFTANGSAEVHAITAGINALTGSSSTLVVDGGSDDQVVLGSSYWSSAGTGSIGASSYAIYAAADGASLWIHQDIGVLIGVVEGMPLQDLRVSPVPSDGPVNIWFTSLANGALHLSVTDLTGRIIFSSEKQIASGACEETLDLSDVPAGVYFLSVQVGDVRSIRKLILE